MTEYDSVCLRDLISRHLRMTHLEQQHPLGRLIIKRLELQTILVGDSGVGKTSLLVQFDTGTFHPSSFAATVGIGFTVSEQSIHFLKAVGRALIQRSQRHSILIWRHRGFRPCQNEVMFGLSAFLWRRSSEENFGAQKGEPASGTL